jgi:hypothetical protein
MNPKSKSTEPLMSSSKSATSQFGQVSPVVWRVSGRPMTIDEYIEDQGQDVNATDLCVLSPAGEAEGNKCQRLSRAA